jgi:hypothetical protein
MYLHSSGTQASSAWPGYQTISQSSQSRTSFGLFYARAETSYSLSEARIVSGELIVRVQDWNFYPAEALAEIIPSRVAWPLHLGCFHFMNGSINSESEDLLSPFINKSKSLETLRQPHHFQGLRQSRFCEFEFQLDVVPFVDLALERQTSIRRSDRYIVTV